MTYTVIYKKNKEWHKTLVREKSYRAARPHAEELERMGYPAIVHDFDMLEKIGMPDPDGYELDWK